MRTKLVEVPSPTLYFVSGVFQINKPFDVQAFLPETAVERFDLRIVRRRPRTRIIQLDLVEVRTGIQCPGDELRSGIGFDPLRQPAGCLDFFELVANLLALDRFVHVNG